MNRSGNEPPDWYMPGNVNQDIRQETWNQLTPDQKNLLKLNLSDPNIQNGGKRTKRKNTRKKKKRRTKKTKKTKKRYSKKRTKINRKSKRTKRGKIKNKL